LRGLAGVSAVQNRKGLVILCLVSFALGVAVAGSIRAEGRAPAYVISEIEVTNSEGYANEYVPIATKALAQSGQKRLVSGGKTIAISGSPPASRIVISKFDSLEQAKAAYSTADYLAARKIGDKYGKLRIFAVEGVAEH
jgi:uncharacterized protein (DUF1330 family)